MNVKIYIHKQWNYMNVSMCYVDSCVGIKCLEPILEDRKIILTNHEVYKNQTS